MNSVLRKSNVKSISIAEMEADRDYLLFFKANNKIALCVLLCLTSFITTCSLEKTTGALNVSKCKEYAL